MMFVIIGILIVGLIIMLAIFSVSSNEDKKSESDFKKFLEEKDDIKNQER